jgi:uncharacterized protein (TIGR02246 family)
MRIATVAAGLIVAGFVTMSVASRAAEKDPVAARLQRLEDRESIRNLLMEYGRTLDGRDWPAFANLFSENGGEWIGGMGPAKGRAAIQKMMETSIGTGPRGSNYHVFTNETIEVRGDTATASTKWMFVTATADKRPQPLMSGHYVDTLVRERGAWKFQRRLAYGDIPQGEPKAN